MLHEDDRPLAARVGLLPVRDPVESQDVAVSRGGPVLLGRVAVVPDQDRLNTGRTDQSQQLCVSSLPLSLTVGSSFLG